MLQFSIKSLFAHTQVHVSQQSTVPFKKISTISKCWNVPTLQLSIQRISDTSGNALGMPAWGTEFFLGAGGASSSTAEPTKTDHHKMHSVLKFNYLNHSVLKSLIWISLHPSKCILYTARRAKNQISKY